MPETTTPEATPKADDWKAPASQAELDQIIGARLARNDAKFADYDEIKAKASEFDKAQEAQKSETQRTTDALAALQSKVDSYESKEKVASWASEITKESAVPASALRGTTREDLEAHFKELEALIPNGSAPPRAPHQKTSTSTPKDDPTREFAAKLFGRRD